jgi:hypothetical protein
MAVFAGRDLGVQSPSSTEDDGYVTKRPHVAALREKQHRETGWPSVLVNGTARPSLRLPSLEVTVPT